MLAYYGFKDQDSAIDEWYDGYLVGTAGVYCPWDGFYYCGDLRDGSVSQPKNYWVNTSITDIIRIFLFKANRSALNEIDQLMNGCSVNKKVRQELTYMDL